MLNTRIKSIAAAVVVALLSACTSSGTIAPGAQTATQCAPNTSCGTATVTMSVPVNVATGAGLATTATGSATALGATTLTMTLDPVAHQPVSATFAGAINTSVALTQQPLTSLNPGSFTGTAATGQSVLLTSFNSTNLAIGLNGVGLTYADFGEWLMQPATAGAGTATYSVWAAGTQLTAAMPTSGGATYKGITRGISMVANTAYQLNGNLTLTASFTATGGSITGNITRITAATFPNHGMPGTTGITTLTGGFNDIALAGTINGNAFTGTATAGVVTSAGPNPAAIAVGTTGTTSGNFYGPNANEVAGVWSLSTATVQASGSFGAK